MIRIYDESNIHELVQKHQDLHGDLRGYLPRRTVYGSPEARAHFLAPIHEYPDKLILPADYKAVVQDCHDREIFPMYHQKRAGLWVNPNWSQNGLNYCWAWSLTGTVEGCRATEGQEPVRLAPTSLGWLVKYRNSGYYLDAAIKGAAENGIALLSDLPDIYSRSPSRWADGWSQRALSFRPTEWFDCENRDKAIATQHGISVLATGKPLYIAYDWWSHAVECVGVRFEGSTLIWIIQNSHDEDDVIEIAGNKGVPDELYGIRSTVVAGEPAGSTLAV